MLINTLTNVNKWYLIVKSYQFLIQIDVSGAQNEMPDWDILSPFNLLQVHLNKLECHEKVIFFL